MKRNRKKHKVSPLKESHESMSALASGMADDFNNILTTVMGACSLIDKDGPNTGDLQQYVALIRASAEHAAALSVSLMSAGSVASEGIAFGRNKHDHASESTSVRDKKSGDGVESPPKYPGGVPS